MSIPSNATSGVRRAAVRAGLLALAAVLCGPARGAPGYVLVDLGWRQLAFRVNDRDEVAGFRDRGAAKGPDVARVWRAGHWRALPGAEIGRAHV